MQGIPQLNEDNQTGQRLEKYELEAKKFLSIADLANK